MLRFLFIATIILLQESTSASVIRADRDLQRYIDLAKGIKGPAFITRVKGPVDSKDQIPLSSCSGTLLNPWTILTAGHCVVKDKTETVDAFTNISVGSTRLLPLNSITNNKPKYVYLHPKYKSVHQEASDNTISQYDIALILLKTPIYDNALGYGRISSTRAQVGNVVTGYGFGKLSDDSGKQYPDNKDLVAFQSRVSSVSSIYDYNDTQLSFSAPKLDLAGNSASGDSGGGVVDVNNELIGVGVNVDALGAISSYTNIVDLNHNAIKNQILVFLPEWKFVDWEGDGSAGEASNWGTNIIPENHSQQAPDPDKPYGTEYHYAVNPITRKTDMIVDKYLHVDRVQLNHPEAKFTVEEGTTARLDYGLEIIQGSVDIKGSVNAHFLRVGKDVIYPSNEINLGESGRISLEGGTLNTPKLTMTGGELDGTGTITGDFVHSGGSLSPEGGNLRINGKYTRTDDTAEIGVRFFTDGRSEFLSVKEMDAEKLLFRFTFPNLGIKKGATYVILSSDLGLNTLLPNNPIHLFSDYSLSAKDETILSTDGNNLKISPTQFILKARTVSDMRPNISESLSELISRDSYAPASFVEYANAMPHEVFLKALDEFSNPHMHKNLHKTLVNNIIQNEHKHERTTLFLEKARSNIDLTSFAFAGKNSFTGDDVLLPQKDAAATSFFISGDLNESGTKYTTDGLTIGWDHASGSDLSGVSFHFKNQSVRSEQYNFSSPQEYHLEFYKAHRGGMYFMDYGFGSGLYSKETSFSNIWGRWENSTQTNQMRIQNRLGVYSTNKTHFGAAYVGLSGSYSKTDPYTSRTTENLEVNTSQSTLGLLSVLCGAEGKIRLHMNDIVIEPAIHTALSIALYEDWNAPVNRFHNSPTSFRNEQFTQEKNTVFLGGALRIHVPQNIMIKFEGEVSGLSTQMNSKLSFDVSSRF